MSRGEGTPGLAADAGRFDAIVIGGSAGAITALAQILPVFGPEYPVPVVIVVHLPAGHDSSLVEVFRYLCQASVKEAEDKEPLTPGTVYVAPPDYHVYVEQSGRLSLSTEEPVNFARPSIDLLFHSAADVYGSRLLAVVLSGANEDGAEGIKVVCRSGGLVLVQAPESAESATMPRAALAACEDARSLSLSGIADHLSVIRGGRHVSQFH